MAGPAVVVDFATYCNDEKRRQERRGFIAPSEVARPAAAAVWLEEARKQYAAKFGVEPQPLDVKSNGKHAASSKKKEANHHHEEEEVTNGAVRTAVRQLKRSREDDAATLTASAGAEKEISTVLQLCEAGLYLGFVDPSSAGVSRVMKQMKEHIEAFQAQNRLGGRLCSIHALYQFSILRTLLRSWQKVSEADRTSALKRALENARLFQGKRHAELQEALQQAIQGAAVNAESLLAKLDAAALDTPMCFEKETLDAVRRVRRDFATPTGTRVKVGGEQAKKKPVNAAAASALLGDEDETDDDLESPEYLADIVAQRRQPKRPQRVDIVAGARPPVQAVAPRAPPRTAAAALAAPAAAAAGKAAAPAPAAAAQARAGPACRSQYHAKYATPEKHASNECRFCTVCHMLEFLFNACTRDCCWKHGPTDRKMSTHLKKFPDVFRLAKLRFSEQQRGIALEPVHIPL